MNRQQSTIFILCIGVAIALSSCISFDSCPENPAEGNLGSVINSQFDDFAPFFFGENTLLFTSNRFGGFSSVYRDSIVKYGDDIYAAQFDGYGFSEPELAEEPPLNTYTNDGSVAIFEDKRTGYAQLFYSHFSDKEDKGNSDLFYVERIGGTWGEPMKVKGVNTEYWEAHPTLSADGRILIFASDRPGGLGGTDLYVSYRKDENTWSTPINLGSAINTKYDELTPLLSENTLYFATRAYSVSRTFDIVSSKMNEAGQWGKPQALQFPINTQFDELSPAIHNDSLYFASNRPGGCGGFDIYSMRLCNDVLVRGQVIFPANLAERGSISVLTEEGKLIGKFSVGESGAFEVKVPSKRTMIFRYENPCYKTEIPVEQKISTQCSSEPMVMKMKLTVPEISSEFNFVSYEVPFFVTGYYMLNTSKNLEDLRLKFAYNLFGKSDSTRYIEFPGKDYDEYARSVDAAINDVIGMIREKMSVFSDKCSSGSEVIEITVEGYADARALSSKAKYAGDGISDSDLNINIQQGASMTNEVLSTLRAYYTMLALKERLADFPNYDRYRNRFRFVIRGRGIGEEDASYERQRKIGIKVRVY